MILRIFETDNELCDICLTEHKKLIELTMLGLFICEHCINIMVDLLVENELLNTIEKSKLKIVKRR